ncbi:MAG: hypothetical protein ACFBWO_08735 [Paracoccaceae bacterium]
MERLRTPSVSPLSQEGLCFALIGAVLLMWPYFWLGGPLVFSDSGKYVLQGVTALDWLAGAVLPATEAATDTAGVGTAGAGAAPAPSLAEATAKADELRSLPYAVFAAVGTEGPWGRGGLALAQGFIALFALWPLVASYARHAARPLLPAVVLVALAAVSSLPYFASYLMPDVFGGVVVLYYLLLLGPVRDAGGIGKLSLAAVGAFALLTHYGNLPLALGLAVVVLTLLALRRALRLETVALAVAPICAAALVNVAIGMVVSPGGGASITPLRMPLMLARSIEDGPARWHLEEACETREYATCAAFPNGIPDNIWLVMWSEEGLSSLDRDLLEKVRAEESTILWRAFLDYPAAQTWSLTGNAITQFVHVGLSGLRPSPDDAARLDEIRRDWREWRYVAETAILCGYLLGVGALLVALVPQRWTFRPDAEIAATLLAALGGNALIFGGLSAPAERYQSRVAWVVIAIAVLLAARALAARPATRESAP